MTASNRSILTVVALAAVAAPPAIFWTMNSRVYAEEKQTSKLAKDLIGTWALAGAPGAVKAPPAKGARLKFITEKCWTVTQADPDTGVVMFHHGGTFTL